MNNSHVNSLPRKARQIFMEVSASHNIDLQSLLDHSRHSHFVEARRQIIKQLAPHYSIAQIGRFMKRDATTISHHLGLRIKNRQPVPMQGYCQHCGKLFCYFRTGTKPRKYHLTCAREVNIQHAAADTRFYAAQKRIERIRSGKFKRTYK